MKRIVVANWKMYVEKPETAQRFAAALKRRARSFLKVDVVIAPPFVLIGVLKGALGRGALCVGAQTLSPFNDAPHTGEVSAVMLSAAGVSHVIVGHSERRAQGESDETIRAQLEQARRAGLAALLCVGERERDPANGSHFSLIEQQLSSALAAKSNQKLVVAYEPVWAIGKTAADAMKPAELQEMVIFIRKTLAGILGRAAALKIPILYGGSVERENARSLIEEGGVAGFLIGHASTDADEFIEILKVCQK